MAQTEARQGNHAAALRGWDAGLTPRDSIAAVPDYVRAIGAIEYLAAVADTARVVMVNERHHAASDRLLTLRLLPHLWAKGFRYFAAEAFDYSDSTLSKRAYPVEETGFYTGEPVFAEIVREAQRLGYTLLPYEQTREQREIKDDRTPQQRRDYSQALNLYNGTLGRDPEAKILVHAGPGHVLEEPKGNWYPMARYFREISGIDPVTVDQTRLCERSTPGFEHPVYRAVVSEGLLGDYPIVLVDASGQPIAVAEVAVDVQVFTPRTRYVDGRPDWMQLDGRRTSVMVKIPECSSKQCFVEARIADEPEHAIPVDLAEVKYSDTVRLFLPPSEKIMILVFNLAGDRLKEAQYMNGLLSEVD